ncbi:hypothetical protein C8R44DRAFT_795883 [Mycena epipterygia]|nr:hypothetical protein C8R44DRAFT_795883 [Mycena epipterygia]
MIRCVSRTSTRAEHPRTQSSQRARLSYHWKTSILPSLPRARLPGRQSHRLLAHTARTLEHLKIYYRGDGHYRNDRPTANPYLPVLPALQSLELHIGFGSDRALSPGVCLTVGVFSATAPHIHTLKFVMSIDTTLVYMRHAECSLLSCFHLVSITLRTCTRAHMNGIGDAASDLEGNTDTILKCGLLVIYMDGIVLGAADLGR